MHRSRIGQVRDLKSFHVGEKLFAEGERDFKFFIVKSGEVAIVDHSSGRDEIVTVHEPREFTGVVDMLTGRPVLVSAIARTPCEAYEISAGDLRRILNEIPRLSDVLLRAFLMRRQLEHRLYVQDSLTDADRLRLNRSMLGPSARQRRARREFGEDPDEARVRPPEIVQAARRTDQSRNDGIYSI